MKKAVLILLIFATAISAEKIRLKDGGVVRGNVVSETATEIVIANEYGNITIEKKNIAQREREQTDIPSFSNSEYSFKKRSWPKFALLGTAATGIIVTALLADGGGAIASGITFGVLGLGLAAADYFRYGRVPKTIGRKFGLNLLPAPFEVAYYHEKKLYPGSTNYLYERDVLAFRYRL